jgi:prepilin-type N-terminal cleavage/methylation domain-containing protein
MPDIKHSTYGFTLIELSIVLVVIGLLAGGIMVGRDLIHAAELRSTISQFQKFDAAGNTFRLKFNCLPGDCNQAVALGLGVSGGAGDNGNGNGMIGAYNDPYIGLTGAACASVSWNEMQNFWVHLHNASLIGEQFTPQNCWPSPPAGKIGPGIKFSAGGTGGPPVWWVIHQTWELPNAAAPRTGSAHSFWITSSVQTTGNDGAASLFPLDAGAMDTKVDDGLPTSGKIVATDNNTWDPWGPIAATAGPKGGDTCVSNSATPSTYNNFPSNATAYSKCGLLWGASF